MAGVEFSFSLHGVQASFMKSNLYLLLWSKLKMGKNGQNLFLQLNWPFKVLPTTNFFTCQIKKVGRKKCLSAFCFCVDVFEVWPLVFITPLLLLLHCFVRAIDFIYTLATQRANPTVQFVSQCRYHCLRFSLPFTLHWKMTELHCVGCCHCVVFQHNEMNLRRLLWGPAATPRVTG